MALPIAPNQTLYLQNLDDRISNDEMKRQLYCLFSAVAPVVEIESRKGIRTRGQAWVSFASANDASIAMQRFQSFPFHGKELRIHFARTSSRSLSREVPHADAPAAPESPPPTEASPVLRVTGFPPKVNAIVLGILFRQVPGYQRVEMAGDAALAYFCDSTSASEAITKMQGFSVSDGYRLEISHM